MMNWLKRLQLICVLWVVALPVSADYMEVIMLGTGTPRPSSERFGAATLVSAGGKYFLFDVGRGTTIRLQQAGILPSQVERIFLTHLHSDHVSGLSDLWLTGWIWQRTAPIQIFGPTGTDQLAEHLFLAHQEDIKFRQQNAGLPVEMAEINSREVQAGVIYNADGVEITAFLVDHGPVKPAFGYQIRFGERTVVISGDTTYSEELIKHATDSDVLIHEITMANPVMLKNNQRLQKIVDYHTTPEQLADVLSKTHPRLTVLSHILNLGVSEEQLFQKVKDIYDGPLELGHDLMKIEVGRQISVMSMRDGS